VGGRGRRHGREERRLICELVDEAVAAGARLAPACDLLGIDLRSLQRWRHNLDDGRRGPNHDPENALSAAERKRVLAIATSAEMRDLSPKQIVPRLADRGEYVASESTFYRVLRTAEQHHRRGRARPPAKRPREHVAKRPWQVASWDITYLRGPARGQFFFLYLVEDIWSRKILGWAVHEAESMEYAAQLVQRIRDEARSDGIDLRGWVLHSDNGGAQRGATMLSTLQHLGIVPSFSRPRVSDDNPFSESLFKTLKYCPEYPRSGFGSLAAADAWVAAFVGWYNHEHLHSGIGFVTPASRHAGQHHAILERRRRVYERARQRRPSRWSGATRAWSSPTTVYLNPEERPVLVREPEAA
jgi:transposase InsO family protein